MKGALGRSQTGRMPKSKKRPRRQPKAATSSGFREPLAAVTKEELHFALVSAVSAADGRTPRKSFEAKAQEAIERGEVEPTKRLFLNDHPDNHMAFAIMEAFPEKTPAGDEKRKALLWRAMFAFRRIVSDPRYKEYVRDQDGQQFVAAALMEAVATTPMDTASEVPVDEVFRRAAVLVCQRQSQPPAGSS